MRFSRHPWALVVSNRLYFAYDYGDLTEGWEVRVCLGNRVWHVGRDQIAWFSERNGYERRYRVGRMCFWYTRRTE